MLECTLESYSNYNIMERWSLECEVKVVLHKAFWGLLVEFGVLSHSHYYKGYRVEGTTSLAFLGHCWCMRDYS